MLTWKCAAVHRCASNEELAREVGGFDLSCLCSGIDGRDHEGACLMFVHGDACLYHLIASFADEFVV